MKLVQVFLAAALLVGVAGCGARRHLERGDALPPAGAGEIVVVTSTPPGEKGDRSLEVDRDLPASAGEKESDRQERSEGGRAERGRDGRDRREEPLNDWFIRQRMSGESPIPPRALSSAFEQWRAERLAAARQASLAQPGATAGTAEGVSTSGTGVASVDSGRGDSVDSIPGAAAPGTWVYAGPNNIGGRITTLGVDPNNSDTLWLGSADGGGWKSTDGGVNWTYKWTQPTALSIGSLVVHPSDSNIVYVGTGEDNGAGYSYDGEGVFKTTDGGNTWTNVGLAEGKRIGQMGISRQHPATGFVAAGGDPFNQDPNRGVYRTTDGGTNWQKVLFVANDAGAIDIAVDPNNDNNVYAATWTRYSSNNQLVMGGSGSAVYKSSDGGTNWPKLTSGLPASSPTIGRIGIAIAKSNPSILYAWYSNYNASGSGSSSFMGIYKTNNGGSSW